MPDPIPTSQLADKFIDELCQLQAEAPYVFRLHDVKQAAAELQRLAETFAPHLEGELALTADDVTQLVARYVDCQPSPRPGQLTELFSRHFLRRAQGLRPAGIPSLAQETGVSAEDLDRWARAAGKRHAGRVFASVANVSLGLSHLFKFKPGVDRHPNWGAGALGYAGALATLDGVRRALLGTDATPLDERGVSPVAPRTAHHWLTGAAESATGLAAIAAALKIAENNTLLLK
jgi:hypothetical protein